MSSPKITSASVKVMRSHDYCHFEVSLSTEHISLSSDGVSGDVLPLSPGLVDDLRKTAARLADKAVEQYKVAKENAQRAEGDDYQLSNLLRDAERISKIPDSERTPHQKAVLKAIQDREHFFRTRYDYEDDWGDEDNYDPEPIPEENAEDALF